MTYPLGIGILTIACMAAFATFFVAKEAIDALRWRDRKRLWAMLRLGIPLALASGVLFLIPTRYPDLALRGGPNGFGPGWHCLNLGGGGAQVCFRDPPESAIRKAPAAAPSGGDTSNL